MTLVPLLLKVTALFALVPGVLPLLTRSTAALRHLLCGLALAGALALPVALTVLPRAIPVSLPIVFRVSASPVVAPAAFPLAAFLWLAWACGCLALLTRVALGYWRISLVRRTAHRTADPEPVYLADVSSPLLCGLIRPAILLPRDSEHWSVLQRAAALRHELAHLRRQDLLTNLLAHVCCAAYWFHPLVWVLYRRLREEQEAACDDAVLSAGFEPADYAEALLAAARQSTSTSLMGCPMLTHRTLKTRIARLLDLRLPRTSSTASLGRAALLSCAILTSLGLIYADAPQSPAPASPAGAESEKVYAVGEGVSAPRVLLKVEPEYPDQARDAKIEGNVMLNVVIGVDGMAHEINVIETPDPSLGFEAVEAVQKWKFQPGHKDGEPVAVRARIQVNFKLL